MKKVLAIVIFMGFIFMVKGQEEVPVVKKNKGHHIGGYAGASSGYGISYRYFPKGVGFQITTTPIIGSNDTHVSIGGMFLFSLNRTEHTTLYGYIGEHYHYDMTEDSDEYSDYYYKSEKIFSATGGGVGFELNVADRIGFNWHLGYAYYNTTSNNTYDGKNTDWRTFIDGGTGIFYKF